MGAHNSIVDIAKTWLKTPFVYGAQRKGRGVDCARFILAVFKEAKLIRPGVTPPHQHRDWIYGENVDKDVFRREILKWADEVDWDDRKPGDVISFYFKDIESHLGILLDDDRVIHAKDGQEVKIQRLKNNLNICRVYRVKEEK